MLCVRQAAHRWLLLPDSLVAVETIHTENSFPGLILILLTLEYIRSIANTITGIVIQAYNKKGGEEWRKKQCLIQRHSVSSHPYSVHLHDSFSDSF